MATQVLPWQSWPELTFHVLAHLRGTAALPASAFDARYCAFVERHAGPLARRPLQQDVELLERLAADHERLARLQTLAWLFDDVSDAWALAEVDLVQLGPEQVARPWVLGVLPFADPALELLRCAALLEREPLARLPPVQVAEAPLLRSLASMLPLAPLLAELDWRPVRALGMRGRVAAGEVWTGVPGAEPEVPIEQVAWQAAHEACVHEVARRAPELAERDAEETAVLLLATRARHADREPEHGRWVARLHPEVRALIDALPSPAQRRRLDALVALSW